MLNQFKRVEQNLSRISLFSLLFVQNENCVKELQIISKEHEISVHVLKNINICILCSSRLRTEVLCTPNAPQVRPNRAWNSWSPDHDSTSHATEMHVLPSDFSMSYLELIAVTLPHKDIGTMDTTVREELRHATHYILDHNVLMLTFVYI